MVFVVMVVAVVVTVVVIVVVVKVVVEHTGSVPLKARSDSQVKVCGTPARPVEQLTTQLWPTAFPLQEAVSYCDPDGTLYMHAWAVQLGGVPPKLTDGPPPCSPQV
mmetsp:Transcript_72996/g.141221  ORF Transcript_72996/g.141221 Transcript_72996/m.141221 type:complete len:106 (+) Transcript_72996:385-702(+)